MMYGCLWTPGWSTGAAPAIEDATPLVEIAPRVSLERRGVVWADLGGLDARAAAGRLHAWAGAVGLPDARVGVAAVPVVAELAARAQAGVTLVPAGSEPGFVARQPLALLDGDERVLALLDGVGVATCGELAALDAGGVEVRFGAAGLELWRRARCDDRRRLFGPPPRERPHGALEFVDYVVTDPERLIFTAHALLGPMCERLRTHGENARRLAVELPLANGELWRRELRAARPTSSRDAWLRLVRRALEKITVPDAVAGVRLAFHATETAAAVQGDLFDRGFATAAAVEAAVARLVENQGDVVVRPSASAHPLPERRAEWRPLELAELDERAGGADATASLTLQLLPEPRRVGVETGERRDHVVPTRYRDGRHWRSIVTAAGPDRVSGGVWEGPGYAREYFRCVTAEGRLVWLFREAREDAWYLHGWWD